MHGPLINLHRFCALNLKTSDQCGLGLVFSLRCSCSILVFLKARPLLVKMVCFIDIFLKLVFNLDLRYFIMGKSFGAHFSYLTVNILGFNVVVRTSINMNLCILFQMYWILSAFVDIFAILSPQLLEVDCFLSRALHFVYYISIFANVLGIALTLLFLKVIYLLQFINIL